jgi:SAM-dependent methyltransferase
MPLAPWQARGRIERPLPLLGPPAAEELLRFPPAKLRAAAEARGLAPPTRASRGELAQLLIREQARAQDEQTYREGGIPFDSREREYPLLCELIAERGLRHVLDLGCGPGSFAEQVLRGGVLPEGGSYLGVDRVAGAIDAARRRFAGDPRARFEVCELASELPRAPRVDGIVLAFVIAYLDTHTADRLLRRLARAWPRATLLVALSVDTSLNGPEERPPERLMRRFLDGDRRALARWDARRLRCYARSVDDHFGIVEEHRYEHAARIVWVARRARARRGLRLAS